MAPCITSVSTPPSAELFAYVTMLLASLIATPA